MEGEVIGTGPYRATKLWNETIKLFRGGMPLRRHWANFRYYDSTFTGSEALDYLHELLRSNYNFGPEVTRYQTLQLLRKFFKAHVIEDVKGRHGTEDFEDNSHLYRFPTMSPLKSLPTRPSWRDSSDLPRLIRWDDYEELPLKENVAPQKSAVLVRKDHRHFTPCWPDGSDAKQPLYPGFERDILRTVADYYQRLKEPLLTYHLYEVFVNILSKYFHSDRNNRSCKFFLCPPQRAGLFSLYIVAGLLQEQDKATEALQVSCLLLPPPNRRRLQLLLRLMDRVCHNPRLPPLNDTIATRTLMFSHCVLGSPDDMDLDELLATKLVTFMMEHHNAVFQVNTRLRCQVEEHLSHLKRAQIKRVDCEEQKVIGTQIPLQQLLEGLIADKELPVKDKKKRLKQKSYPEVYQKRFPTEESKAAVIPEKTPRLKPHLMFFNLKKPFQPFQRSWSFRA
ncbi:hypothetical protein GOODEAATRI_015233 [Goodea atripinnis]|uniref:Rho-GAP domain-containing protein n=1 Tax=Goodea atripinnis TaxID=208336 RepID=A0ABV0PNR6_9TELE